MVWIFFPDIQNPKLLKRNTDGLTRNQGVYNAPSITHGLTRNICKKKKKTKCGWLKQRFRHWYNYRRHVTFCARRLYTNQAINNFKANKWQRRAGLCRSLVDARLLTRITMGLGVNDAIGQVSEWLTKC